MTKLSSYRWPGNARELENVVERMMVLSSSGRITVEMLPGEYLRPDGSAVAVHTGHLQQIDLATPFFLDGHELFPRDNEWAGADLNRRHTDFQSVGRNA